MINIIAAIGKNRELGRDNKLLWHIPEDFKRFKDLTSNHVVIMGRKTFESLPEKFRPLPKRINIVVTRNKNAIKGLINQTTTIFCNSIETALDKAKEFNDKIFIIGGASIYAQGIKYADKLYLTLIDKEYPDADAFFPEFSEFKKVVLEESKTQGDLKYKFVELTR